MKKVADKEELLRILTEDGMLTDNFGKRSLVHKNGLWHQEVGFIPFNSQGQILLQKRSKNKTSYPNCWALCAGHVVGEQTPLQAAAMEGNEELGLSLTEMDLKVLVEKTKNEREDNKCYATCFCKFIDKPISYFKRQKEEVDRIAWVAFEDFKKMVKEEDPKVCIFKNNEYYQKIVSSLEKVFETEFSKENE